jgi:hypothetical protein
MLSRWDVFTLQCAAHGVWYAGSLVRPLAASYAALDARTLGCARYLLLLLLLVAAYYASYASYAVLRSLGVAAYRGYGAVHRLVFPVGGAAVKALDTAARSADSSADTLAAGLAAVAQGAAKASVDRADAEFDF